MCTRCIRVSDEVAKDHVLDMRERGNRNEIVLAPGRELDHKYTLMTEHVCPVGALTSSDFRFKARVWFLKSGTGVCTGCATGCNTHVDYDPRYGKVYRLRPRDNADVNQFWMCDDGMMTYTRHDQDRLEAPTRGRGAERAPIGDAEAIASAAELLSSVEASKLGIVLSAQHTTEDNLALAKLATALGAEHVYLAALGGWEGDDILRSDDNNPNRAGALAASGSEALKSTGELIADVQTGTIQGVLALGWATTERLEELTPLVSLERRRLADESRRGAPGCGGRHDSRRRYLRARRQFREPTRDRPELHPGARRPARRGACLEGHRCDRQSPRPRPRFR